MHLQRSAARRATRSSCLGRRRARSCPSAQRRAPAAARRRARPRRRTPPPEAAGNPEPLAEGAVGARELREQRQKNCETARERQERYSLSRRLFRTNADGEREYLDDAAVAEARAKAAADVARLVRLSHRPKTARRARR